MQQQVCPRDGRLPDGPFVIDENERDRPDDDGACYYCGSMNNNLFMARLETADIELGPTDKDYKVYVKNLGGKPFKFSYRIDSMESRYSEAAANLRVAHCAHDFGGMLGDKCKKCGHTSSNILNDHERSDMEAYERGEKLDPLDKRHWKWATKEVDETKFYFYHLTKEQKQRFVELLNDGRLKIGEPHHFYALPYFIRYEE